MKASTKQQIFAYVILFALLAVRIPIADLVSNFLQLLHISILPSRMEGLRLIQSWTFYFWENGAFVFVGLVILASRYDLRSLNIDKYFVAIFVVSGAIYCIYFFRPTGWIAAFIAIYLLILSIRHENEIVYAETSSRRIVIIILIGFLLGVLLIGNSLEITKIGETVRYSITRIPFAVVEEVMFRGLFWMLLRNLNLSELKIVFLQATLFWLFHAYSMFSDPFFFWITTPVASILLGIIVWRSKSITPSTIAHILFNLWWWLAQSI